MNRRVPLVTRTPLRRTGGPRRVAGLPRQRTPIRERRQRHMASNTPARRDDLTRRQRGRLYARYGGMCESQLSPECTRRLPETGWQAGHRANRGRGGNNTELWNRTANCPWCNYWQEDHPAEAEARRLYLRTGLDPRTEPLILPDGREVFLLATGKYLEVPA